MRLLWWVIEQQNINLEKRHSLYSPMMAKLQTCSRRGWRTTVVTKCSESVVSSPVPAHQSSYNWSSLWLAISQSYCVPAISPSRECVNCDIFPHFSYCIYFAVIFFGIVAHNYCFYQYLSILHQNFQTIVPHLLQLDQFNCQFAYS